MDLLDQQINSQLATFIPIIKLSLALAVGIAIGWEREVREAFAGLRVMPLVTVGATLFTVYGGVADKQFINPQVAAGVVTGVGFLCAGVISRAHGALSGVTTASAIWVAAALGMGIGLGLYVQTSILTIVVLAILWFFPRLSYRANHNLTYELVALYDQVRYEGYQRRFQESGLTILRHALSRDGDQMHCIWFANGRPATHRHLGQSLINDPEITRFGTRLD